MNTESMSPAGTADPADADRRVFLTGAGANAKIDHSCVARGRVGRLRVFLMPTRVAPENVAKDAPCTLFPGPTPI